MATREEILQDMLRGYPSEESRDQLRKALLSVRAHFRYGSWSG
jgi:hypothetical protein